MKQPNWTVIALLGAIAVSSGGATVASILHPEDSAKIVAQTATVVSALIAIVVKMFATEQRVEKAAEVVKVDAAETATHVLHLENELHFLLQQLIRRLPMPLEDSPPGTADPFALPAPSSPPGPLPK